MSDTRFQKGQSGNPRGRPPRPRRPNISAFEIVLDKRLTTTVGGNERELTVEEVLQQQTLKDALAGKRMAIRKVLKMIEKREAALAKKFPSSLCVRHDGNASLRGQRQPSHAYLGHRSAGSHPSQQMDGSGMGYTSRDQPARSQQVLSEGRPRHQVLHQ
ncbi:DUF5681 domain-containing protein [Altererythrobacter arenosus]|uniref:DUF5681 domain-containing protein n=1 Tax=Altererythrobacter arenosus TaxID=3032592 RepID=A0ABY8FUN4_9SPHN|nr:DUF5681 domain-containing protein [Altererythrobacter sp. CAU 1644]WFL77810.1 DUF5681 domain-containing protein [Altererythrobacter sp. CAU 1644]